MSGLAGEHGRPHAAEFDAHDHATTAGWASHHAGKVRRWRHRLTCGRDRHDLPFRVPEPANGHSPSCHDRCFRCGRALKWFVVGQHRYGGYDAASSGGDARP